VYGKRNYQKPYVPGKPAPAEFTYDDVAKATGFTVDHLYDIASVSRSVPKSVRRADVRWSHHRAVSSLPQDRQEYWLEMAAVFDLDVRRLRDEIALNEPSVQRRINAGDRSLLLPPVPEEPKPQTEPKPAPLPKNLEAKTHLTALESETLRQLAFERGHSPDVAIRALVMMGLHELGTLQALADTATHDDRDRWEFETQYLYMLGEAWFGDRQKFLLNLPDEDRLHEEGSPSDIFRGRKNQQQFRKIKSYIDATVKFLRQVPEFSASDVAKNLKLDPKQANYILAEAKKIIAAEPVVAQPEPEQTESPVKS